VAGYLDNVAIAERFLTRLASTSAVTRYWNEEAGPTTSSAFHVI
jgi:hypothetical protein